MGFISGIKYDIKGNLPKTNFPNIPTNEQSVWSVFVFSVGCYVGLGAVPNEHSVLIFIGGRLEGGHGPTYCLGYLYIRLKLNPT